MIDPRNKLLELVHSFDTAMLTTVEADGGLRSRPMAIAEATDTGEVWFLTSDTTGKTEEINQDVRCAVTMQGDRRFVSLRGLGEIVDDREKITKAWSETMRPWFPEGPSAPDLVLIHFVPDEAEYWDSSGLKGVRFLFEAAKAIVTGRRLNEDDPRRHGSVNL